ncbi:MAG: PaaI family thioesterase [Acidobacteriota bacterium]
MAVKTHELIDPRFSGEPIELAEDRARVRLDTDPCMRADATGLVHGGFVFSLADHAAMLAVNHPNVVLGSASTRFLRPVRVGESLVAEARVDRREGAKIVVAVTVHRGGDSAATGEAVMTGEMVCFTPGRHVLGGG